MPGGNLLIGFLLSTLIGGLAYWRRSLSRSGWLGAMLVGTLTFGAGGLAWGLLLITFFVTSSLLSRYQEQRKLRTAGEKFAKGSRRDLGQTLANGGLGALLAIGFGLTQAGWLLAAFVGVMATVTADTWATELGTLSRQRPRLITTGRAVDPGTSGAVTLLGTLAAAGGASLIGLAALLLLRLDQALTGQLPGWRWDLVLVALLSGLAGTTTDSLLGATVQVLYTDASGRETERAQARDGRPHRYLRGWRWMNNDMVNLLSSGAGAVTAALVALLLRG